MKITMAAVEFDCRALVTTQLHTSTCDDIKSGTISFRFRCMVVMVHNM